MRNTTLLGGLATARFMRRHWQKSAHLARQALPGFPGIVNRRELFALAGRDDVESRVVVKSGAGAPTWSLERGPFPLRFFKSLPPTNWTLLVQGLDLHLDAASALIRRFAFLPYARLDDLMVSYAVPGGGVGPHFDSYDVFLLQGPGRRRWRTSTQADLSLVPGLPLKILAHFEPEHDWVLDPGDMLYLPPSVAHDGVAVDECMTYSIGFRAPTADELVEAFLHHLPDALDIAPWRYADPDLAPTDRPGLLDPRMQKRIGTVLKAIRWSDHDVARFSGCFLSEPKADVFFDPPPAPLAVAAFARHVRRRKDGGVRLDRRSRMLYDAASVYLNGAVIASAAEHPLLRELADRRELAPESAWSRELLVLLHDAYSSGALHVGILARP